MTMPHDTKDAASDAGSDTSGPLELSSTALAALNEFMRERADAEAKFESLRAAAEKAEEARKAGQADPIADDSTDIAATIDMSDFGEDWQLSQFWYTDATRETLAREALDQTTDGARIGCVSSPSAFVTLRKLVRDPSSPLNRDIFLFEFDRRFGVYGSEFVFFDYNHPTQFEPITVRTPNGEQKQHSLQHSFDFLIVDPPFLSEECWTKTAQTVSWLLKPSTGKVLVCTGKVMGPLVCKHLNCTITPFLPMHQNGLKNEFRSYINYKNSARLTR